MMALPPQCRKIWLAGKSIIYNTRPGKHRKNYGKSITYNNSIYPYSWCFNGIYAGDLMAFNGI
jgi:hypothetical protein